MHRLARQLAAFGIATAHVAIVDAVTPREREKFGRVVREPSITLD